MPSSGGHPRSSTSALDSSVQPDEETGIDEELQLADDENRRSSVLTAGLGQKRVFSGIYAASNRSMHPKTGVPLEFDKVVGSTADHNCFGVLSEGPIRNGLVHGGHYIMSDHRQTEVYAGDYKDINRTQEVRRVNFEFQSKDCSFDITDPSKKLVDVKDAQVHPPPCNGRDISSQVSAEGKTCIESKHVSDSKEKDEQLEMQSLDSVNKCSSSFLAPTILPGSLSADADFQDRAKRPAIMCKFFAIGKCNRGSICRFVHKGDNGGNHSHKLGGDVASEKIDQQFDRGSQEIIESPSSANGSRIASDRHIVRGSSSTLQHSQLETGLAGFGVSVSSHSSSILPFHRSAGEASLRPSQYMFNDHNTPGFGYSLNHYHLGNHSSSHSSLRQDHFGDHNFFTSQRPDDAFRSSLVQNPFPSSSVGTERSYSTSITRESHISNGSKSKFIPHNWEPSTPFQSSLSIPLLSISAPGTVCDTIHDSIEQPEENISAKPSLDVGLLSEGAPDSLDAEKRENNSHEKDITVCEAESVATSATDPENRTSISKEGSYFDALMNIGKASQSGVEGDQEHQNDRLRRHRIELKVDGWKKSKIGLDDAEQEDMLRESKSVKHFRAALVVLVKGLMKPVWHEGQLTKDAYKIIVQKVEEKVTNSLQEANLIPSTSEHVKQYLSSSRTKILNLIEAYADRYRKHGSN